MNKLREYLNGERGRKSALAARLQISPSAISMWDQVPTDRVSAVAAFTGIPAEDLRPDLAALFAPTSPKEDAA
jgi:DNA-binding transcriptional regulator YdaS (Cro superfamily)